MIPSVLCRHGGDTCPSVSLRIKLSTTVAKSSLLLEVARVRTLPPLLLLAVIVSSTCTSDEFLFGEDVMRPTNRRTMGLRQ